jgi:predicted CXXCH cytochrome family protein
MKRSPVSYALMSLLVAGLLLGPAWHARARAAVPEGAKYSGPKLCLACHKGMNADIVAKWSQSAHALAMWPITDQDADHKVVGDFSANPPFPKDQVTYVLGTGRVYQSYLDKDLQVLPGDWVVADNAWRPRQATDGARDCVGCHTTGFDLATKKWAALGVGCEMCHGPGSVHVGAKDKKAAIVNPANLDPAHQAMVCGQCHAQGKSKDGSAAFPVGFRPGDDLNDYFVLATEIPKNAINSQYNELVQGGGKHLAAGVVCTTCHDPHGPVSGTSNDLRAPVPDLCLSAECHGGKLTGPQHSPEAVKTTSCVVCHMPGGKHTFVTPSG